MKVIDTSGLLCPAPLIATKRALKETEAGDSFQVITDSKTSFENISRFLKDNKTEFSSEDLEGKWTLIITKKTSAIIQTNPEDYCKKEIPHLTKGDFITVFKSDCMGDGDEELGHLLMVNFMKALKDIEMLPGKMIFYNKGVLLGAESSPVLDHLKEIEKMGVTLLFCETCVKYYALGGKMKVGTLSNMFEIAQAMASASNIITP